MSEAVLDASAILAVLNGEPGGDLVVPLLGNASISTVNYAEVASKLINSGAARKDVDTSLALTTAATGDTPADELNRLTDLSNDATYSFADACGLRR